MLAPSLISVRRFPESVRPRIGVAFAMAWEALTATHQQQLLQFVRLMRGRLSADDALHRYFREVAVPALMQETVRARTLIALAGEVEADIGPAAADGGFDGFGSLRFDQIVDSVRRRVQSVEQINLAARLAASLADEAVSVTHVRSALVVADLLSPMLPLDEALMCYLRAFDLPAVQAQVVFQRALAQLAERHPLLVGGIALDERPVVRAPRAPSRPTPAFGLRALG